MGAVCLRRCHDVIRRGVSLLFLFVRGGFGFEFRQMLFFFEDLFVVWKRGGGRNYLFWEGLDERMRMDVTFFLIVLLLFFLS